MKKYFITGLIILLPVALTLAIMIFIFNFLTVPFLSVVKTVFDRYDLFSHGFLFLTDDQIQNLFAQLLILLTLFLLALGLGFIARGSFFRAFSEKAEHLVIQIPLVSTIYKTCRDVIKTIFTSGNKSFKQVVMVRFPNPDTYSIGLITRETIASFQETTYAQAVAVFVPTTPNPTSGFLVMYKSDEIIYLDMTVEDAFKYIISCGMISPPFTVLNKNNNLTKKVAEQGVNE